MWILKITGSINQGEVQRLLAALLADNPALDLDEGAIQKIVQQVHSLSGETLHVEGGARHRTTDGMVSSSAKALLRLPALTWMKRQVMRRARLLAACLHRGTVPGRAASGSSGGRARAKTPVEAHAWCLASHMRPDHCVSAAAQTFAQADTAGDGIISPREWLELVTANPSIIDYMTLPVLKEVRHSHHCITKVI